MTLRSWLWKFEGIKSALGVEAPKEVPVHRREVFDAIHRNELAAGDKSAGKADTAGTSGNQ